MPRLRLGPSAGGARLLLRSLRGAVWELPLRSPPVSVLVRWALPLAAVAAAAVCAGACGYGWSARYVARGGASRIEVRTFENRSTEPELGAALTTALRTELARRGADAGAGAGSDAVIEGDVRAGEPVLTSAPTRGEGGAVSGGTWRIAVDVRARLVAGGATVAEHAARREADYLVGADGLETEGRRALALRRLADETAREVLRAFERR